MPTPTTEPITQPTEKMWAIAQTEYGSPDVLQLVEVARPTLDSNPSQQHGSDHHVLVKVHATSVHAGDWHLMRGTPFLVRLIYGGLRQPRVQILGCDVAGKVEAVGKAVTQFKPGDDVFGELSESGFGAFAEYVCAPETAFALKPTNITDAQAGTVPVSAISALQGLRDIGKIQVGQKVLINGAAGGVGSFAVQIAKAFGAEVTAVCHASKVEMVRSLGADYSLDYSQALVRLKGEQYDLILDTAAYRSVYDYFPILKRGGSYVLVGGSMVRLFQVMLLGALMTKLHHRTIKCLVSKPNQADLIVLKDLIEAGKLLPYIDRAYTLSEIPAAIRALEQRQIRGKVSIRV
jgi:NADPH:quinone reductase-like Zn-dependent oxidoreductase